MAGSLSTVHPRLSYTRLLQHPAVHGLHTPRFTLDEGVLKLGAALHAGLASQYLQRWHERQAGGAKEEL